MRPPRPVGARSRARGVSKHNAGADCAAPRPLEGQSWSFCRSGETQVGIKSATDQQISFILYQSLRLVSKPFARIALLAATSSANRTGTDLEISSSRLYHLEMASSASSEAPRRPLDTRKSFCGPNLAQGWQRVRSPRKAPIAATPAAPSPPAQSSVRPAAAPSYLPRRLPRAAHHRALRFSPRIPRD